jgi:hypothetical protein
MEGKSPLSIVYIDGNEVLDSEHAGLARIDLIDHLVKDIHHFVFADHSFFDQILSQQ